MTESAPTPQWRITTSIYINGCAYGSRYPSLVFNLEGMALSKEQRAEWQQWLESVLPPERTEWPLIPAKPHGNDWEDTLHDLLRIVHRVQHATAQAVFEQGTIQGLGDNTARCQVPTRPRAASTLMTTIQLLLRCLDHWASGQGDSTGELAEALQKALDELERQNIQGTNVPSFIKAATDLKIPFQEMPGLIQYGVARRSCWLDSSHTGHTSHIGVQVARDKLIGAGMLARSGLPVPRHALAHSAEQAVAEAKAMGYPVVVKPTNQAGGAGVMVNLLSDEEVSQAFEQARRFSSKVMVEKYVEGRDYRLLVFQGELIWAIEREPGGVTGDGQHTVAELLEQLNQDPRRGDTKQSPLKRLPLDEEAELTLQRQQLNAGSVPGTGQFVALRRAANVTTGGRPVPIAIEQVHPDNRLLAERAAQACRLDIAGIDLLMSDISRSWMEVGATIIEVNNQPQLGQTTTQHLYAPLLSRLVPGNGRVPVVVVLGAPTESNLVEILGKAISSRQQMVVGYHDSKVVSVNNHVLKMGTVTPHDAAQMLMMTPTVDAMVLSINDLSLLETGLPFPYFDVLAIAGAHLDYGPHTGAAQQPALQALLRALLSCCDGKVVTLKEAQLQIRRPADFAAEWLEQPVAAELLISTLVDSVAEAEQRHRQAPTPEQSVAASRH